MTHGTRRHRLPIRGHIAIAKSACTGLLTLGLLALASPQATAVPIQAIDPAEIDQDYAQSLVGPGAQLHVVTSSIQAAVDAASPGDVVFVPPGTYMENVEVRTAGLTIVGSRSAILDGTGLPGNSGIDVRAATPDAKLDGFNLVGMSIRNYQRNGVFLRGVDNYQILSGEYVDNQQYGIFPRLSNFGLIEGNVVSGADDTGIYLGVLEGGIVRNNRAFDNTIGIELENVVGVEVLNNSMEGNSVGLFGVVLPLPTQPIAEIGDLRIEDNRSIDNNRPNPVTDPEDVLSRLPSGVGMLFIAADDSLIIDNIITGNGSVGLGLLSLPADLAMLDPRIDPEPDFNRFVGNQVTGNGTDPDPKLGLLGLPPVDLLWDTTGAGNVWSRNSFGTSFPTQLPEPVPEPAPLLLLGLGAALALAARRRRRAADAVPA